MKTITWILLVAFLGLIFAPLAAAETIEQTIEFPYARSTWTETDCVEKFNLPNCDLEKVTVRMSTHGFEAYAADNEGPAADDFIMDLDGRTDTTMPNGDNEQINLAHQQEVFDLAADELVEDPDPDFEGDDSFSKDFEDTKSKDVIYSSPTDLAFFIGDGDVCFTTTAVATQSSSGPSGVRESKDAYFDQAIVVTYEYTCHFCINGSKINDCDGTGIPGWQITLKDINGQVLDQKQTDENGDYSFCGLAPGDYVVCEEDRDGWVHVDEPCRDVTLDGENIDGVDFHNVPLLCISGHKFNSKTGAGVSNWKITLTDANGEKRTTTTGTGGYYEFCRLEPGDYTVCEELKPGWKRIGPECIDVTLECENSEGNDFENEPITTPCGGCPWFIKNDLYKAKCGVLLEVPPEKGILANDPVGTTVIDPELITIDPKYGTIEVYEDGSFFYDPSLGITSGTYVIFKYGANNGLCDAKYLGIAKIQVACSR